MVSYETISYVSFCPLKHYYKNDRQILILERMWINMLEENYSFRIIGEDDFNIKSVNESLWSIRENMFENLYDVQKSLTNIHRFDFKMSEFSNKDSSSVRYNIPIQFIHNKSRIAYRHSPFYKRLLTYEDVFENRDLFLNTIMIFIDGQLYTNY